MFRKVDLSVDQINQLKLGNEIKNKSFLSKMGFNSVEI
jgi:hypothetical protein